jgi:hypothetical protein
MVKKNRHKRKRRNIVKKHKSKQSKKQVLLKQIRRTIKGKGLVDPTTAATALTSLYSHLPGGEGRDLVQDTTNGLRSVSGMFDSIGTLFGSKCKGLLCANDKIRAALGDRGSNNRLVYG